MGFECEEDAQRVYAVLPKRFGKYGLNLHPTKTRLIPFARPCMGQEEGKRTAEKGKGTFDFLGFTHHWGRTRKGGYAVKRKTASKRMSRSLKAINQWNAESSACGDGGTMGQVEAEAARAFCLLRDYRERGGTGAFS